MLRSYLPVGLRLRFRALLRALLLLPLLGASAAEPPATTGSTVLYDQASPYERVLVVEVAGRRILRFGSVGGDKQSVLDLARPEIPVLEYIPRTLAGAALADKLDRGLVIGFGAGTVTRFWHRHFPEMWIDSVEIDPLVTAVAFQFFGFAPHDRMPIHVMDGRAFVRSSLGGYDLVLLDAFGAGDAPYHLTTLEFYREVQAKLAPGGVVIANMVAKEDETMRAQARTFTEAFAAVYRVETPYDGNVLLIGASAPALSAGQWEERLAAFVARATLGIDLAALARLSPQAAGIAEAPLLHD